ncbi:ACP S-malonyltransferase [Leeia sp. TBRC 13508]|uniref:Malonyl CoA-acyl carrier protein transacylase n=1 Tax=Leeia speluncae TaxID=2884804 RepID=A0ABS8D856_9NEIS|nr:ACP S-malonyltransferase [Leeia speluncae]MCB6184372.1 ACP S-malonyltransferase [Leeia speluncae]
MSVAFVFPGQGSQSVGMMNAFADVDVVKATFAEASEVLGFDVWQLVNDGPQESLNATVNTQPVMLTADVAIYRAWLAQGGAKPAFVAGHSLGEYAALVAAEVLSFADALKLVKLRAEAMQAAVPEGVGAMAAILGLDDAVLQAACDEAAQGEVVAAVNYNSAGQTVIAGHKAAVERTCELAKAKGAKRALLLPVSVPSHCELMKPAAEKLNEALSKLSISAPTIEVIHNVDVAAHSDAAEIANALVEQLYKPVRWVETVQALHSKGATVIAECGPGKVLLGLNKRIASEAKHIAFIDPAQFAELAN